MKLLIRQKQRFKIGIKIINHTRKHVNASYAFLPSQNCSMMTGIFDLCTQWALQLYFWWKCYLTY